MAFAAWSCAAPPPGEADAAAEGPPAVVSFTGGTISREELQREANRLPPALRESFERRQGAKLELAKALADKKLLVGEARRRGLADEAAVAEEVRALEERLLVQELLAREEAAAAPIGDDEARAWFEANRSLLQRPARVQVRRILLPWTARTRRDDVVALAERIRRRLLAGASAVELAREGSGPERMRDGDLGYRTRTEMPEGLGDAAFALQRSGEVSRVIESRDGAAVLVLVDRQSPRDPSFDEVRAEILTRLEPERKRRALDALLESLRREAGVRFDPALLQ